MRRPRRNPTLAPLERHRSRSALVSRVIGAVVDGASLATIARREHMPRHATSTGWLRDPESRRRYDTALELQRQLMIDDIVQIADRAAAIAHGKRRVAAVRRQIEARKLWVKLSADDARNTASA